MAFNFNFNIRVKTDGICQGDAKTEKDQECSLKTVKDDISPTPQPMKPAREHSAPSDVDALLRDVVTETVRVGALPPLLCVNESVLELTAEERQGEEEEEEEEVLKKMAAQRSDLLPGVYEGGLRVWECTYDLLAHLDTHLEREGEGGGVFTGRRVLDLGCGAGLLGVMAMRLGAEQVDFQDYNSTVIRQLTIANAALNQQPEEEEEEEKREKGEVKQEKEKEGEEEERKKGDAQQRVGEKRGKGDGRERQMEEEKRIGKRGEENESPPPKRRAPPACAPLRCHCRFFSGDWTSFLSLIQQRSPAHKYDIILTSETIYNTDYYAALHALLHRLLADDGQVLLATKAHYFGVGGGLLLFERFVEERGVFETRRLLDVDEGLQRHVLSLTFKRHDTHNTQTSPSTHSFHATASNGALQKVK
ncbi:histidine protein methyltransferase 1 homolog isoform X2 [Alosa alosa]|uniref:histidine protein methyltransferase 1 homolog isoform X2 n=1 Tax=Alosa alosa TaxID=278164 RepID=UPI0020150913|nr:histidine protein methyltransferase 1 homolog isoform X2 [Alosa alosa]